MLLVTVGPLCLNLESDVQVLVGLLNAPHLDLCDVKQRQNARELGRLFLQRLCEHVVQLVRVLLVRANHVVIYWTRCSAGVCVCVCVCDREREKGVWVCVSIGPAGLMVCVCTLTCWSAGMCQRFSLRALNTSAGLYSSVCSTLSLLSTETQQLSVTALP